MPDMEGTDRNKKGANADPVQARILKSDFKVLIYKAVMKPIWAYGVQLWGPVRTWNLGLLQGDYWRSLVIK